ncbi:unnamed protein product [Dicrocoelium dendriticum]|nr:unnamed protein product [Dicrocoelium dendriticum]
MFSVILIYFCMSSASFAEERFSEEVLIKELGHGFTSFHFNFVSQIPEYEHRAQHHNIVPKAFLDLLSKYSADELHLSIVRGYWDDEHWGRNFVMVAPTGAELWAWFHRATKNVDQAWFELAHAVSGLFCASLNRMSSKANSAGPQWSYRPVGISDLLNNDTGRLRYAQMPGESLCSENLTPWIKLLPCKDLKGLASLLVPTSLFRSNYLSLRIGLRRVCWDHSCTLLGIEAVQTLTVVFDRRILYRDLNQPWSFKGLLGSTMKGTCDAAHSSRVIVITSPVELNVSRWVPSGKNHLQDNRVQMTALSSDLFDDLDGPVLFSVAPSPSTTSPSALPLLSVSKYLTGSGVADGGIRVLLTSRCDFTLKAVYLDLVPWYLQVLFSSLRVHQRNNSSGAWTLVDPVKMNLVPNLSRQRMGTIELLLSIPPTSQVSVSYTFHRVLQRWDEYPPDANHGYFLPATSISYQVPKRKFINGLRNTDAAFRELALPNWASTYTQYFNDSSKDTSFRPGDGFFRVHSAVILISMPTPDFSMPFNTLCIVCSVIAMLFGSVNKATAGHLTARPPSESETTIIGFTTRRPLSAFRLVSDVSQTTASKGCGG